jgi:hypothetical protein
VWGSLSCVHATGQSTCMRMCVCAPCDDCAGATGCVFAALRSLANNDIGSIGAAAVSRGLASVPLLRSLQYVGVPRCMWERMSVGAVGAVGARGPTAACVAGKAKPGVSRKADRVGEPGCGGCSRLRAQYTHVCAVTGVSRWSPNGPALPETVRTFDLSDRAEAVPSFGDPPPPTMHPSFLHLLRLLCSFIRCVVIFRRRS